MNIKFSLEEFKQRSFTEKTVISVTSKDFIDLDPDLHEQIIHGDTKDKTYLTITTFLYSTDTKGFAIAGYFSDEKGDVVHKRVEFGGGLESVTETGYIDIK